jgi:hypothetical protein
LRYGEQRQQQFWRKKKQGLEEIQPLCWLLRIASRLSFHDLKYWPAGGKIAEYAKSMPNFCGLSLTN